MTRTQTREYPDFKTPLEALKWCWSNFGKRASIGTSLQGAGLVILHMAYTNGMPFPVFTIDTGVLFQETLDLKEKIEKFLSLQIESLVPEFDMAEQGQMHGEKLWLRDPDLCCHMRKVLPLQRKLETLDVWITGVRRDQSKERSKTGLVEAFQRTTSSSVQEILKVSPMADWSRARVDAYLLEHKIPTNALLEKGYRSIGCMPCTSPVAPGADERDGRWQGLGKKECGIHTFFQKPVRTV